MKPVHVCVVVFNRYDLLARLMASLNASTRKPDAVYIINRGNERVVPYTLALEGVPIYEVPLPGQSLAAAWNWFILHVPEERILASDDIEFHPEAIDVFTQTPGDFLGLEDGKSSAFACFLIRNPCVEKIGLFDELISPDYLYFEDWDYGLRMEDAGIPIVGIRCLTHGLAQSWERKTQAQQNEHHNKFRLAQANFEAKWGERKPGMLK